MPMYEYQCTDCGHKFDELVKNASEVIPCPKCGSERTFKLISMFSAAGTSSPAGRGGSCNTSNCSTKSCFT
ncbi:MAG: zinc ribbon domain-containing protein [candidate division Zixibacteria bacterium]|nr:zinc ribbon domain-containing protein [candidate division Zixibacteria bacterium]MDD5426161.1 zinc ribbon domain-containing protein [candidate division Zixibacteria bacterium]